MDWFKFEIRKWMDGRIALAGISAQGLFLNLAMRSMLNGGGFAPGEFMAERLHSSPEEYTRAMSELVRLKLVECHGDGTVTVPWADKVAEEWNEIAEKRANAGRVGMAKRWGIRQKQVITSDNKCYHEITPDNNQKQNITDIDLDIDIDNTYSRDNNGSSPNIAHARDTINVVSFPQTPDEIIREGERQGMAWTNEMAETFLSWHGSRAWMTSGGVVMVDWRKALRAWFNRENGGKPPPKAKFGRKQVYGDTI